MAPKKSSTSGAHTAPRNSKGSTSGPSKKAPPTNSGESQREGALLEHIGRYRLSILPIIARLFFDGNEDRAADTLRALTEAGKLQTHQRMLGRYSYYQLTPRGCVEAGVTEERAKPLTAQTLPKNLAVLGFATMKGVPRVRLRDDLLPPGCPTPPGKAPHVAEMTGPAQGRIYRVQIVAELQNYKYPFERIEETVRSLKVIPNGSDFLRSGAYAFAVLVNEESNKTRFEEALPTLMEKLPGGACVVIETAPSPNNLPLFLA